MDRHLLYNSIAIINFWKKNPNKTKREMIKFIPMMLCVNPAADPAKKWALRESGLSNSRQAKPCTPNTTALIADKEASGDERPEKFRFIAFLHTNNYDKSLKSLFSTFSRLKIIFISKVFFQWRITIFQFAYSFIEWLPFRRNFFNQFAIFCIDFVE